MLPDSIYLSHQFSFHAFTHDWQAPLHRGLFDIPSVKLEVRKEVEATLVANPSTSSKFRANSGGAESFIQDTSLTGSPFDEPLATAIHARLEPTNSSVVPVLPSYPNGLQMHPSSWKNTTTPLRHAAAGITDGVGEGLGRLRRELGKKATKGGRKRNSLTFDEQDAVVPEEDDEDFAALGVEGNIAPPKAPPKKTIPTRAPAGTSTGSESTLSTANAASATGDLDDWRETEVADDVAEYEAFETFEMDEDHHRVIQAGGNQSQLQSQSQSQSTTSLPPNAKPSTLGRASSTRAAYAHLQQQLQQEDRPLSSSYGAPALPPPPSQTRLPPPPLPPPPPAKNTGLPAPPLPPLPPGARRRRPPV